MRKFLLLQAVLAVLILLAASPLFAQTTPTVRRPLLGDTPKAEIYGGYSYMNVDGGETVRRQHGHGWGGSVAGNFHRSIGVVFDAAGHYGRVKLPGIGSAVTPGFNFRIHEFMAGPRVTYRGEEATLFVHLLVGVSDMRITGGTPVLGASRFPFVSGQSRTDFSWAVGGGLDYNLRRNLALRLFQFDYVETRRDPTTHDARVTVGFVARIH